MTLGSMKSCVVGWLLAQMSHVFIVFPSCSREKALTHCISSETCNQTQPDSGGYLVRSAYYQLLSEQIASYFLPVVRESYQCWGDVLMAGSAVRPCQGNITLRLRWAFIQFLSVKVWNSPYSINWGEEVSPVQNWSETLYRSFFGIQKGREGLSSPDFYWGKLNEGFFPIK